MQNPENLVVARLARELSADVYRFASTLPPDERFNLATQMKRASTSILSNIHEGCGRQSRRALVPFLYIANASALELHAQLLHARDSHLGDPALARSLPRRAQRLRFLITKLIKALGNEPRR